MDCFSNLIGIKKGCGDVQQPTSGLFLDSLTGISVADADAAINAQYASGLELLTEKRELAMNAVKSELRAFLQPHTEMRSIVEGGILGWYKDNMPAVAAEAAVYKGIQVDLYAYPYSSFNLTHIRLQAQTTGTVTIKVFDLVTSKEIDSFEIETIAGEISETTVNKTYHGWNKRLNLAIVYDATNTASYKSGITENSKPCASCNNGWKRDIINARGVYFRTSQTAIQSNTRALGHTAGLSINYNLSCDTEPFLCGLGNALGWPVLHKWAAEVMKEFQYSTRLNSVVLLGKASHKELREEYEKTYKEAMQTLLSTIRIPDDICFGCKPVIKKVVQIP